MNHALTGLRKGDYAQGWAEYKWRWKKRSLTSRPLIMPEWNGDMLELLRVKDVFTRQTWVERLLGVGTVVVLTSDDALPTFYLTGGSDPKKLQDLVWHYARAERDRRSVKVEEV